MSHINSRKVKRIIAMVLCIVFALSVIIPCFAAEEGVVESNASGNGLTDTQILYTVTQDGEIIQFAIFDYYDAKTTIISSDDYMNLISQGYAANTITYSEFVQLKEQTNADIYGSYGWEQFYPDSITVTDINAIPKHAIFHDVYDMDGTLHHLYCDDGIYYDVSDELYQARQDAIHYEDHEESEEFSDEEIENQKKKGNAVVKLICRFGTDVPDGQRLALIVQCIETYEQYSLKVTPPDYSVEVSLPLGTYTVSECYSLLDRDTGYTVIGQNKAFHVDPSSEEKKEVIVKIGEGVRDEDFEEYKATDGYTQNTVSSEEAINIPASEVTPYEPQNNSTLTSQAPVSSGTKLAGMPGTQDEKGVNVVAWVLFGLFILSFVIIFLKIKSKLEENR